MATGCYKTTDQGAMYFESFAIVDSVDVFNRKEKAEEYIYISASDYYGKQWGWLEIEFGKTHSHSNSSVSFFTIFHLVRDSDESMKLILCISKMKRPWRRLKTRKYSKGI